jgi:hypothetical protein
MHINERQSKGRWFWASTIVYEILIIIIMILIPITLTSTKFFSIHNRSHYVEVANLFDTIDLYLQGHCIKFVNGQIICQTLSFPEMFYKFPNYSIIPNTITPSDFPIIFSTIPGQNNFIFIPLFIAEFVAFICFIMGINAFKTIKRRSILFLCIPSMVLMIILAACVGISNKIYNDILPSMLNKPMNVQVEKNGELVSLSGKATDIGIKFATNNGTSMLAGILVTTILSLLVNIRWIPEGFKKETVTMETESTQEFRDRVKREMIERRKNMV